VYSIPKYSPEDTDTMRKYSAFDVEIGVNGYGTTDVYREDT